MIKVDKGKHEIKGKTNDILTELSLVIVAITKEISEKTGDTKDEVLAMLLATLISCTKVVLHTENKEGK